MRLFLLLFALFRDSSAEENPLIEKGICFEMPDSHFQVLKALSDNWKCTVPKCCFGDYTIWDGRVECEVEDDAEVVISSFLENIILI